MHVVIVGGGVAGSVILTGVAKQAKSLLSSCPSLPSSSPSSDAEEKTLTITLIDPKDYVEIQWANYRALFDSAIATSSTIPYADLLAVAQSKLPSGSTAVHKQQSVTSVDPDTQTVTLSSSETVNYDVLVLATGAATREEILSASEPSKEDRRAELAKMGERLTSAKSVLVTGGGPIGVEIAGDIKYFAEEKGNKECEVTLVQKGKSLVPVFGESAGDMVVKQLEKLGVTVYTSATASMVEGGEEEEDGKAMKYCITPVSSSDDDDQSTSAKTNKPTEPTTIQVDIAFNATGVNPQSPGLLPGGSDSDGWVVCDEYGRVIFQDSVDQPQQSRVFAYGDCVVGQPKTGSNYMMNQKLIAGNICAALLADGEAVEEKKLKKLSAPMDMGIVTVGKGMGVAKTPVGATSWMLPLLKNKTMMLFSFRQTCGV